MKKISYALLTAAIIALVAILTVPLAQAGGNNIYANGVISIAAGATQTVQNVELRNNSGNEWGEILGYRLWLNGPTTSTGEVTLVCYDLTNSFSIASQTSITGGTTRAAVALAVPARAVKITATLTAATTNGAYSIPWCIYAK